MSAPMHTPGPWFYGDEDEGFDGVEHVQVHAGRYCDPSFREIARVEAGFDGDRHLPLCDETRANARLIAAAPELLEALIEAAEFIQPFNRAEALLEKIDAAIAKARGEA